MEYLGVFPQVAMDANSNAISAWEQWDGIQPSIWANRLELGSRCWHSNPDQRDNEEKESQERLLASWRKEVIFPSIFISGPGGKERKKRSPGETGSDL